MNGNSCVRAQIYWLAATPVTGKPTYTPLAHNDNWTWATHNARRRLRVPWDSRKLLARPLRRLKTVKVTAETRFSRSVAPSFTTQYSRTTTSGSITGNGAKILCGTRQRSLARRRSSRGVPHRFRRRAQSKPPNTPHTTQPIPTPTTLRTLIRGEPEGEK